MQLNCIAGKSRTAVIIFCKVIISPSENSQPVDVEKRRVVFFFWFFFFGFVCPPRQFGTGRLQYLWY